MHIPSIKVRTMFLAFAWTTLLSASPGHAASQPSVEGIGLSMPSDSFPDSAQRGTGVGITDSVSREVSVYRPWPTSPIADAISREVSVHREVPCEPPLCYAGATSREVSVYKSFPEPQIIDTTSREVSAFSVIPLTLGTPYTGSLPVGSFLFFRVTTPPEETVRITLRHNSPTAITELLASFGAPPDSLTAQFAGEAIGTGTRELVVPATQAGTYFILVRSITDSNPSASTSFDILATTVLFGIDRIEPNAIGTGEVTLRLRGGQLDRLATIVLHSSAGGPQIEPAQVTITDAATARIRFNLHGFPLGPYDLVAESHTGQQFIANSAIMLEAPIARRLEATILPAPLIRRSHGPIQGTATLVLTNTTNVDLPFVFVELSAPSSPDLTLSLETDPTQEFVETHSMEIAELVLESLAAGETITVPIHIALGRGYPRPNVAVYAHYTILTRTQFRDGFLLGPSGEVERWLEGYRRLYGSSPEFETEMAPAIRHAAATVFDDFGLDVPDEAMARSPTTNRDYLKCKKLCRFRSRLCRLAGLACGNPVWIGVCEYLCEEAFDTCTYCCSFPCDVPICRLCPCPPCDLQCSGSQTCPQQCRITWYMDSLVPKCDEICVPGQCTPYDSSADPNEKTGPSGFGNDQFIKATAPIPYRIYFENLADATAPAAEITITDQLDEALDLASFRVRQFKFGPIIVDVPEGRSSFSMCLDLTKDINLLVCLEAGVNSAGREATFSLRAIDPLTMQVPAELDRGFLPPNDDIGRGEGYVEFEITPQTVAPTGTVVTNKAPIVFDYNDPIVACAPGQPSLPDCIGWFNTIDAGLPTAKIEALAPETASPFIIQWGAQDDNGGSGIAAVDVFVAVDDGPYQTWMSGTGGWAWFEGEIGKSYAFYAVARDLVGNAESMPDDPDTSTVVTASRCSGDTNTDTIIDLLDHLLLVYCLSGDAGKIHAGPNIETSLACADADLNRDRRADLLDFALFQQAFGYACKR